MRIKSAPYVILGAVSVFLLFTNLGRRPLWGDEAETALLGLNILKYGVPKNYDGANTIAWTDSFPVADEDGVYTYTPWLDKYLSAASFAVFGKSTTAARLPFAIIGLLSVGLFAFTAFRFYGNHQAAITAAALLATSELFILHARQCRYYSILIFAQIWFLYGAQRRNPLHIFGALALQFHANYIAIPGNLAGLGLMAFLNRHYRVKPAKLIPGLAGLLAVTLPWILYAKSYRQTAGLEWAGFIHRLSRYLTELHFHAAPFPLLLVPANNLLWVFVPVHLLILGLAPGPNMRYALPLLPVLILMTTGALMRFPKVWGYSLAGVLCFSNFLSVFSFPFSKKHYPRLTLPRLARSVVSPYQDRFQDTLAFLREHGAGPGQSLYSLDPEFPLIFYTGMKVIDGRFAGNRSLQAPPDWILSQSASGILDMPPARPSPEIESSYERFTIPVHHSRRSGVLPEPDSYAFATEPEMTSMLVYRKSAR